MLSRIEAREIVVKRDGRSLVRGASLALQPGEIASIEGPSGSGKSTFLRALATLLPRDSGRVLVDGVDDTSVAPWAFRRRVAYVAQQPPMFDGTVADNIATGPKLAGDRIEPSRVAELVAAVGLPVGFEAREAREASGGERTRVALARALAIDPSVLLLDEPTAALDPESAGRVLALVSELATRGLTVLVVTHSEADAARLEGRRYQCREGALSELRAAS